MKKELEQELNELSPFLADLKKQQPKEPFRTPRLYFDTLADKVLDKAKDETTVAVAPPQYKQGITLISRINNWLSTLVEPKFALSVFTLALVFSAGWYLINQQKAINVGNKASEAVTQEDLHNYINDHIEEFKEEDIALALAELKHNKLAATEPKIKNIEPILPKTNIQEDQKVPTHPESGLTEEELEEYLNEHLEDADLDVTGGKL